MVGPSPRLDRPTARCPDPREQEIPVHRDLTNRQLSIEPRISERTAASHVAKIIGKLGLEHVVPTLDEGVAHRPSGYAGVAQEPHPRPARPWGHTLAVCGPGRYDSVVGHRALGESTGSGPRPA